MKKIISLIILSTVIIFAAPAQTKQVPANKTDTVRDMKNQPKPHAVKNRYERMRLQQRQIKYHQKQLKKVHDAQKELNKELHKRDSSASPH